MANLWFQSIDKMHSIGKKSWLLKSSQVYVLKPCGLHQQTPDVMAGTNSMHFCLFRSNGTNWYFGQKDLYFCQYCKLKAYRRHQSNEMVPGNNSVLVLYRWISSSILLLLVQYPRVSKPCWLLQYQNLEIRTKLYESMQVFNIDQMFKWLKDLYSFGTFLQCVCVEALRTGVVPPKPRDRDRGQTRTNSPRN